MIFTNIGLSFNIILLPRIEIVIATRFRWQKHLCLCLVHQEDISVYWVMFQNMMMMRQTYMSLFLEYRDDVILIVILCIRNISWRHRHIRQTWSCLEKYPIEIWMWWWSHHLVCFFVYPVWMMSSGYLLRVIFRVRRILRNIGLHSKTWRSWYKRPLDREDLLPLKVDVWIFEPHDISGNVSNMMMIFKKMTGHKKYMIPPLTNIRFDRNFDRS